MNAECSHQANWRRTFHTKISLCPLWSFQPTLLVSDFPTTLQDMLPCNFTAVSLPDRLTLTISAKILLPKKKSLTGCHELLGKVFMARVGMINLVPEMRQNTGTDVRKAHHRLPARHTIHFCRTYYSLDNLLISLQVPYMHESRKKLMLSNWSTRKDD